MCGCGCVGVCVGGWVGVYVCVCVCGPPLLLYDQPHQQMQCLDTL